MKNNNPGEKQTYPFKQKNMYIYMGDTKPQKQTTTNGNHQKPIHSLSAACGNFSSSDSQFPLHDLWKHHQQLVLKHCEVLTANATRSGEALPPKFDKG